MKKQGNWLCTFEINNLQHDYARLLRFINWLEELEKNDFKQYDEDFVDFYISRMQMESDITTVGRIPHLLTVEASISEERNSVKLITETSDFLQIAREYKNRFSYYIRVNMSHDKSDIAELRYLILLFQMCPSIVGKVFVRFKKLCQWNSSDYYRISDYLRFQQSKYNCFYACTQTDIKSLNVLRGDSPWTQSTFIPLMEVDTSLCRAINRTFCLENEYQEDIPFESLFGMIHIKEKNADRFETLMSQIAIRILLNKLPGRKYGNDEKKRNLLDLICGIVNEVQGVTVLDLLFWGAVLPKGGELDYSTGKELLGRVQAFTFAIGQILENVVNHSEFGKGVFTVRVQRDENYIARYYPHCSSLKSGCLELFIADGNMLDGMTAHFLNSSKADANLRRHETEIELRHLFGDINSEDPIKSVWEECREIRPAMCHGLMVFSNGIHDLKGAIKVRSSSAFLSKEKKEYYYFNGSESSELIDEIDKYFIPGTQYSIAVNDEEFSRLNRAALQDWGFDFDSLTYATTYRDLGKALHFVCETISINSDEAVAIVNRNNEYIIDNLYDQQKKDQAVLDYSSWFENVFVTDKKKQVFALDLERINEAINGQQDLWEPFCKGLLGCSLFVQHKRGEKKQKKTADNEKAEYVIIMLNPSREFSLALWEMVQSFKTARSFSAEHCNIYFYPDKLIGNRLFYTCATFYDMLGLDSDKTAFPRVFPYPLFLKNESGQTIFEEELIKQASCSIYEKNAQGYKLENTHMRLGNKVHIDAFFEMALFFENPNYAYYTAYLFLQKLIENSKVMDHKKIVFYGYSSYSRSIVWAVISILKEYYREDCPETEFIIYQNDLKIESDQTSVQMYYSNVDWQRDHRKVWKADEALTVFIVPISSSLTTFNKMAAELERETGNQYVNNMYYTALWVRNINNPNEAGDLIPTTEEEDYWSKADTKKKTIYSPMIEDNNCISYLADVTCLWEDPLRCKKCFPDDPIMEYPLVETDPTSTVPTQQYYLDNRTPSFADKEESEEEKKNNERVWLLKNNLIYGHISKSGNHYQYYFKVREYFQQQKEDVKKWLKELREAKEKQEKDIFSEVVNIIIVPQQTNNMEFAQFVYEFYFQGNAECIIVNTEKEFRSNLQAEYSGLFNRIISSKKAIKFYYVDVAINSGSSYNRAISLVSSCFIEAKQGEQNQQDFCIDRVFLLISRMSDSSKESYVRDARHHFHAYVNVNISSMRMFGDSCVPCKIQEEARVFYKKAATPSVSAYWENKVYDRRCVSFDNVKDTDLASQEDGFRRMICSHRVAHYLRPIKGAEVKSYFEAIKRFLDEICHADGKNGIYREISDDNRIDWIAAGLKILVRPFFSYDYKMRCAVMDLYLILSEILVKNVSGEKIKERIEESLDKNKEYLTGDGYIKWMEEFAEDIRDNRVFGCSEENRGACLEFIRNNILKGLADIRSNYLLRKDTIVSLVNKLGVTYKDDPKPIREYFNHYIRTVLRMTHSSSDETKSVWLECLLQTGFEYYLAETKRAKEKELWNSIDKSISDEFERFRKVLLVENNRPLYQAVNDYGKYIEDRGREKEWADLTEEEKRDILQKLYKQYHMKNATLFLGYQKSDKVTNIIPLYDFLKLLNSGSTLSEGEKRYVRLGEKITEIVNSIAESGSVILFGENKDKESVIDKYLKLSNYFILYPESMAKELAHDKTENTKRLEDNWAFVKKQEEYMEELDHNGFFLFEDKRKNGKTNTSIFIKLNNNYSQLKREEIGDDHQKIEPIYIFVSCSSDNQNALHLIRCILMFRQKLVEWLERDFNNNTIAELLKQKHWARLLSMDKMGDHAEMDFVGCHQKTLITVIEDEYKKEDEKGTWDTRIGTNGELERVTRSIHARAKKGSSFVVTKSHTDSEQLKEWFLMRAYINSRVSRLFRTMARMENEFSNVELYETELNEMESYYNEFGQSLVQRPARNLGTMFFSAIRNGESRKNYLKQMAKVITFQVEGICDYGDDEKPDEGIEERLSRLSTLLSQYNLVHFVNQEKKYSYLSEYLAVALLDCFVSGFKVCEEWSESDWGGGVFLNMLNKPATKKCRICIRRADGGEYNGIKYDCLEISNEIHPKSEERKKGPGMSRAAITWYIEGLWRIQKGESGYPEVKIKDDDPTKYIIQLPILERKNNETHTAN